MTVFEATSYKEFVKEWVLSQPKRGHGVWSRIAKHLDTSTVAVSQVFQGERELSHEQALVLSEFMGLTGLSADYFEILVLHDRTTHAKLKARLKQKLEGIQQQADVLKNRVIQEKTFTEEAKGIFYSNWYYSAIHLSTLIPRMNTVDAISSHLNLPTTTVIHVLEFLVEHGLCLQSEMGTYSIGPRFTHLENTSPHIARHHTNWRLKALDRIPTMKDRELFYSGNSVLSKKDVLEIRRRLVSLIEEVYKTVAPSENEELMCLNIDWFEVK